MGKTRSRHAQTVLHQEVRVDEGRVGSNIGADDEVVVQARTQRRIDSFFQASHAVGGRVAKFRSKRLGDAVARLTNDATEAAKMVLKRPRETAFRDVLTEGDADERAPRLEDDDDEAEAMAELDLSQYSSDAKSPVKTKPEPKPKRRADEEEERRKSARERKNKLDDDDDDTSSTSGTRRTSARTRKKTTHRECACSIKTNVVMRTGRPDRRPDAPRSPSPVFSPARREHRAHRDESPDQRVRRVIHRALRLGRASEDASLVERVDDAVALRSLKHDQRHRRRSQRRARRLQSTVRARDRRHDVPVESARASLPRARRARRARRDHETRGTLSRALARARRADARTHRAHRARERHRVHRHRVPFARVHRARASASPGRFSRALDDSFAHDDARDGRDVRLEFDDDDDDDDALARVSRETARGVATRRGRSIHSRGSVSVVAKKKDEKSDGDESPRGFPLKKGPGGPGRGPGAAPLRMETDEQRRFGYGGDGVPPGGGGGDTTTRRRGTTGGIPEARANRARGG